MPWVSECRWIYRKYQIQNAVRRVYWKWRYAEWIGGNDAEIDVYLAREALDIPYRKIRKEENIKAILRWLNGER